MTEKLSALHGGTGLEGLAAGSLLFGAAGNVLATLAIGAAGRVLVSDGSEPYWRDGAPQLVQGGWRSVPEGDNLGLRKQLASGDPDFVFLADPGLSQFQANAALVDDYSRIDFGLFIRTEDEDGDYVAGTGFSSEAGPDWGWGYLEVAAYDVALGPDTIGLTIAVRPAATGDKLLFELFDRRYSFSSPWPLHLPRLTTTQRDALDAEFGFAIANITTGKINFYGAAGWEVVTSA